MTPDTDENQTGTDTLTLDLTPEIEVNGKTYDQITLKEPVVADFVAMARKIGDDVNETSLYDGEIELVRVVSGLPAEVIDRMRADLLDKCRDFLMRFEARAREEIERAREGWGDTVPPSYTLDFDPEISGAGKTWPVMELAPPTVGQMRRARVFVKKQTLLNLNLYDQSLLQQVSGWPKAAVLALPISKKTEAMGYLDSFFGSGR